MRLDCHSEDIRRTSSKQLLYYNNCTRYLEERVPNFPCAETGLRGGVRLA